MDRMEKDIGEGEEVPLLHTMAKESEVTSADIYLKHPGDEEDDQVCCSFETRGLGLLYTTHVFVFSWVFFIAFLVCEKIGVLGFLHIGLFASFCNQGKYS